MIVYKLTNLVNGRIYVGQTQRTVEERFKEHCQSDYLVGKAIKKYGAENFKKEVIEECNTQEELDERERYWIAYFDCIAPKGYNLTDGGESGFSPSEITREKIAESLNSYYENNPEVRQKISEQQTERFKDPEEREKAAERTRKRFEDPAEREKQSECQKKRFEDPAEHEKVSIGVSNYFSDPEARQRQSERITKAMADPVAKANVSAAQKKRFEDPAEHEKVSLGLKRYFATHKHPGHTPETRKKISEKRKAYFARKREEKLKAEEANQILLFPQDGENS